MTTHAPYLLWVDTETTGLIHRRDTVLEASWMVTDADANPLTPLRSRFTALHTEDNPTVPEEGGYWEDGAAIIDYVREMHSVSGLTAEHAQAQTEGTVIRSAAVLEELMVHDLRRAQHATRAVHVRDQGVAASTLTRIAGDGVGHFETEQFGLYFPRLTPGGAGSLLHYRPCDTSHYVEVATKGTGSVGDILAADRDRAEGYLGDLVVAEWPSFGLRNHMDDDRARAAKLWIRAVDAPHRAAADVVRSWAAYRLIHESPRVGMGRIPNPLP